jgi:hypothetical protein
VSPAKAAINSDWAIAEKVTGAWLLCQGSSALQCPAQLNIMLGHRERTLGSRGNRWCKPAFGDQPSRASKNLAIQSRVGQLRWTE